MERQNKDMNEQKQARRLMREQDMELKRMEEEMGKRGDNQISGKGCVSEGYKKTRDRQQHKEEEEQDKCIRCCMNEVLRGNSERRKQGSSVQWKGSCAGH